MKADPSNRESLQAEAEVDPMDGEQTWPTESELLEAEGEETEFIDNALRKWWWWLRYKMTDLVLEQSHLIWSYNYITLYFQVVGNCLTDVNIYNLIDSLIDTTSQLNKDFAIMLLMYGKNLDGYT